jgi:hypothetical protein
VYAASCTFGDDQIGRFLEGVARILTLKDAEDTNIGLEYRYSYSAAQNRCTMSSNQHYTEHVLSPPVFDALNVIPALNNLAWGINSLANSTRFSGPRGQTRYVFVKRGEGRQKAEHIKPINGANVIGGTSSPL